jgi:hypothetical protein
MAPTILPVLSSTIATQAFGDGPYSIYVYHKYWYIDKLLQTPLDDFRKRGIDLLLAHFLITIKGMPPDAAERIILNWLDRCSSLRRLDFDAVKTTNFLPLGKEKFKVQDSDLFYRLSKGKGIGGGN